MAEVLATDTPELFRAAVARAAELLRAGQVVALPTETVYGLAANALDADAVARIFEIKGRPAYNPIIVHVDSVAMARRCAAKWPVIADRLAEAFWPGPLTVVVTKSETIPPIVTAGGPTVGVRWPSHPLIQGVISVCNFPLAAPSANRSSEISPTTAEHVRKSIGDRVPLIVDGGASQVGIESTVLDITVEPPRVLRPGMIHTESLLAVTDELADATTAGTSHLKSPGLLLKHYAPKAKVLLWSWQNDAELKTKLTQLLQEPNKIQIIAHTRIPLASDLPRVSVIPHDDEAFARALYAELHRADETGAAVIIIEQVPNEPTWQAISDRLRRAASE